MLSGLRVCKRFLARSAPCSSRTGRVSAASRSVSRIAVSSAALARFSTWSMTCLRPPPACAWSRGWPTPKRSRQNFVPTCSMTLPMPLWPGAAAVELELHSARRQVELVVRDEHVLGRDLVVVDGRADGLAAQVHVGRRLQQADALARDRDLGAYRRAACAATRSGRRARSRAGRRTRTRRCGGWLRTRTRDCRGRR